MLNKEDLNEKQIQIVKEIARLRRNYPNKGKKKR